MKKKIAMSTLVLMLIVFIIGLVLIFTAVSIGDNAEHNYRINQGSYLESNAVRVGDKTTLSFQLGGVVISLIGGFGTLLSGYVLYKEL